MLENKHRAATLGHAFHQLAVEVWDVLESCGLRPFDSVSTKEDGGRGGVGLRLVKDGVSVGWLSGDDAEKRIYETSKAALQLRTSGAVLTSAISTVLLAHSFHVRAAHQEDLPMPLLLLVTGRQ
ncbi:hypothetical protein [Streptomyces xiamenensis]|uniref:hypothetical protein n=1 Tax=Streptomyces xiamenensis TaxID=408015 RepID=UPI0035E36968